MTHESSSSGDGKVRSIRFGHCNIYLIEAEEGYILVDAGMPGMAEELDAAFQKAGIEPTDIDLIIATHGHLDHVGSMAHAQTVTSGKVLCHRSVAKDLANGRAERAIPRNLRACLLALLTALMGSAFDGVHADILMDDDFDLSDYGVAGRVIHTPGHSPSSMSIMLDNGEALIGDMVREEGSGKVGLGMFYDDKETLVKSLERVAAFEPRSIYLSHGDRIDNTALRDCIVANR